MKKTGSRTLKYPILKDLEYISIVKNKKSVLETDGKELEGKTWRDFQIYLGDKLPIGRYYFTIKFKKSAEIFSGQVRAVSMDAKKTEDVMIERNLEKLYSDLSDQIKAAQSKGGITFEMLLSATKQGYEAQINFLNQQLAHKENLINEFKKEVDELDKALDDCERETSKHNTLAPYLSIAEKFLTSKFGNVPTAHLKESNPDDIPKEILDILGAVDYSKIDDESMQKIIKGLKQYISFLPLKGN